MKTYFHNCTAVGVFPHCSIDTSKLLSREIVQKNKKFAFTAFAVKAFAQQCDIYNVTYIFSTKLRKKERRNFLALF